MAASAWQLPKGAILVDTHVANRSTVKTYLLPNETLQPGDNILSVWVGRGSRPAGLLRYVGDVPPPFQDLTAPQMTKGQDAGGAYYALTKSPTKSTSCVAAIRRAGQQSVFLRNCVLGSANEALQPILIKEQLE
ncbi:MAG: hypothetical protein MRY69_12685 [Phaeobacter italicus]|nr:hypothetical protein [Phaeobacter italicus]